MIATKRSNWGEPPGVQGEACFMNEVHLRSKPVRRVFSNNWSKMFSVRLLKRKWGHLCRASNLVIKFTEPYSQWKHSTDNSNFSSIIIWNFKIMILIHQQLLNYVRVCYDSKANFDMFRNISMRHGLRSLKISMNWS